METNTKEKKQKPNINNEQDHEKIKKNLENYIHIHDRHYHLIPIFSRMRYIDRTSGDFYYGGIIIANRAPEYILVRGIGFSTTWRIKPEKYTIFIEDPKHRKQVQSERNNLYRLFCEGKLKFSIDQEQIEDI